MQGDPWVELSDLRCCRFGALDSDQDWELTGSLDIAYILPNMLFGDEELRTETIFIHNLFVLNCHRPNPSKNKVLGDFVGKSFHADEEYIRSAKSTSIRIDMVLTV